MWSLWGFFFPSVFYKNKYTKKPIRPYSPSGIPPGELDKWTPTEAMLQTMYGERRRQNKKNAFVICDSILAEFWNIGTNLQKGKSRSLLTQGQHIEKTRYKNFKGPRTNV